MSTRRFFVDRLVFMHPVYHEAATLPTGCLIGRLLLTATSPFSFSVVPERTMLRFLKLIACDNGKIGTYAKLVDDRNESAHPNGNIFFSTPAAFDTKIREILRVVDEIQTHSTGTIQRCYTQFLEESNDPDDREYSEDADQIREILIDSHYFSQKDIEICAAFDWQAHEHLKMHTNSPCIESLHQTLKDQYVFEESV